MNFKHKYRITLEDETTLEKKFKVSWQSPVYILVFFGVFIVAIIMAISILAFSPLRNTLPGYLKESERAATEDQHLRLDSIMKVYDINEAYVSNIFNVLNPEVSDEEQVNPKRESGTLSQDSLLPTSQEEKNFIEFIRERDKYNIAVASPAEAETLLFEPPNSAAVISENTKDSYRAEFLLPQGEPVSAIAEGKVISIASSPRNAGAYEVIIQHPKGFLSKSSRLSNLLIRPGDHVIAGQVIGHTSSKAGMKGNIMILELWHDGDRLIPARYLKDWSYSSSNAKESHEKDHKEQI